MTLIDEAMRRRIDAALDAIAHEEDVRILLAIESGSRAWGFPSRDSDYDVRFIYVRPRRRYLSIAPDRDVLERPIDGALDLGGWDLVKALQLAVKSNAVLLEWFTSPVRYRAEPGMPDRLWAFAADAADLGAIAFHYDHIARRSFAEITAQGSVRLKTYCYALRPALALLWLRRYRHPAPMNMAALVEGLDLAAPVRAAIDALIEAKAVATERDLTARLPALDTLIGDAVAQPVERPSLADRAALIRAADALLASIVA